MEIVADRSLIYLLPTYKSAIGTDSIQLLPNFVTRVYAILR